MDTRQQVLEKLRKLRQHYNEGSMTDHAIETALVDLKRRIGGGSSNKRPNNDE